MGGTCSPQILKISKSIWNYLLPNEITIIAEHLPRRLNVRADWESRNATDSSNWKLHHKVYLKITKPLGTPAVDLQVGISSNAAKIISMSRRPGPATGYESA